MFLHFVVDVSAAINVYKNLKCSPDINIAIFLQKKSLKIEFGAKCLSKHQ